MDETPTASISTPIRPFRPPSSLYQTGPLPSQPAESRAAHPIKSKTRHKNNLAQFIHVFTRNLVANLGDIRNKLPQHQNVTGSLLEKVHSNLLAYYTHAPEIINQTHIADVVFWPTVDGIRHTLPNLASSWIASLTKGAHGCWEWCASHLSQALSIRFSNLTNFWRGIICPWLPSRSSSPPQPRAPRPDGILTPYSWTSLSLPPVEAPKAEADPSTMLIRILRFFGILWLYKTIGRLVQVLLLVLGVAAVLLVGVAIGFALYGVVRCWLLLWTVGRKIGALVLGGA
ncbi:MAG: hypothetical protein OHK93_005022 [Ramalina farinacea]|uniref:Uncharacterized protein n=1 Tax=Ramalina farinacea TaxID=258253 RepID=A0AA43QX75_9LECA|nr:hypothetical protein [Ramalina farinacea]